MNLPSPCRIEFRLNSSRLANSAFRFLVLSLSSYLLLGGFVVLATRFDPLWWVVFAVSLAVLWPVAVAGRRVLLMLFEWPALVIDENEIVDRRGCGLQLQYEFGEQSIHRGRVRLEGV